jgi:3D (Asp-Asp-Asp) domain-containing protein
LDEDDTYITQTTDGVSEITVRRGDDEPAETEATVQTLRTTETYATTIPYEIVYCNDASLPAGTQRVLTNGETGEMSCTANVEYLDGSEVSRTVLSQTVTRQPVNALIAVGTGEAQTQQVQTSGDLQISNGMITLPTGEVLTYTDTMTVYATAYTCEGYMGITATGTQAREGAIAVDPDVIPYGTRMFIVSNDGQYVYGIATAEDTGDPDFICGDRVDLYFDTLSECITFGYRDCTVYFLGETEIQREYWGY